MEHRRTIDRCRAACRRAVAPLAALLACLVTTPARADDQGAYGQAAAALVILGLTLLLIIFGVIAAFAGRANSPRRAWKPAFAVVVALLAALDLVWASRMTFMGPAGSPEVGDVVVFLVIAGTSLLTLAAAGRLFWRAIRPVPPRA